MQERMWISMECRLGGNADGNVNKYGMQARMGCK